jgi:hypothetical protein
LYLYSRNLRNEVIKGKESDRKPLVQATVSPGRVSISQKRWDNEGKAKMQKHKKGNI